MRAKDWFFATSARRRALLLTLLSLVGWSVFYVRKVPGAPADLSRGPFSDHFSHMNAARFFTHVGIGKWQRSMRDSLRQLTPQERAALPEDLRITMNGGDEAYEIPGYPKDKPIVASWSNSPHFYPPGDLVLVAPVAALYHFTSLSFGNACRLLILCFLFFAHAGVFFLLEGFLSGDTVLAPVGFAALFFGYSELLHWSLEGFYDCALIVPLILCSRFLRAGKGLAGGVAYCAAAFIHFRAFFFAPLAIYAAYLLVQQKAWKEWTARHWAAVAVAAVLGGTSLITFALVLPKIGAMAVNNPVYAGGALSQQAGIFLLVLALCSVVLVRAKAWMDLSILVWLSFMVMQMRSTYEWYMVVLLGLLGLDVWASRERASDVREVRLVYFLVASALAFRYVPIPHWYRVLFE